jgi:hypothetical protein
MNPTKQQIEEAAKSHAKSLFPNTRAHGAFLHIQSIKNFIAGAEYAMSFKPEVSKSFEEYEKKIQHLEGHIWIAKDAWNACQAMMQERIDSLIEEMRK